MKKYIQLLFAAIVVACNVISAQTNVGGTTPPPAGVNLEVSKPGTTELDSIPGGVVTDQLLTVDTSGNVRRIAFSSLFATASQAVFSDNVFAGKATAFRKNDVLYDIIDSKTGGMLTYKK